MNTLIVLLVGIALHLLGDYLLQRILSPFLPKKATFLGLLIHCLYADTLCYLWLGAVCNGRQAAAGYCFIFGVAAHLIVDSLALRGSIMRKVADQSLHVMGLLLFALIGAV